MIDKKVVEHIAKLARLDVSEQRCDEYAKELGQIMAYFEQIEKVDTMGVEPLVTPSQIEAFWREDFVNKENSTEELIQNAPDRSGNLFKVPPVV
jgi:aspartyl-tRNA(Asn)/glutamyl-tRNA(Gln) amidotransferase subunit C